jgi:hypothetical protein
MRAGEAPSLLSQQDKLKKPLARAAFLLRKILVVLGGRQAP